MAHVENYNARDADGVINEHAREYENYKNDVDRDRTKLNFGYGETNPNLLKHKIVDRVFEIMGKRKIQEQTNVISEWAITFPGIECDEKRDGKRTRNVPRDPVLVKKFFDEAWRFCQERYGLENVLAGFVHMDEVTPHMHLVLVPEATSRKTGKRTVSSASLMTRDELRNFHRDLDRHMQAVFGDRAREWILNGRTAGNYTVRELKDRQARERALEGAKSHFQKTVEETAVKFKSRSQRLTEAKSELDAKTKDLERREQQLAARESDVSARELALVNQIRKQDEREQELDDREREFQEWEDKLEAQRRALDQREQEQARFIKRGRIACAEDVSQTVTRDETQRQNRRAGYTPWE